MTISRAEAMMLADGDYHVLAGYDNEISQKAYFHLQTHAYTPKVVVDYEREAYLMPVENVRITFDKRVRAFKGNGLFVQDNAFVGVLAPEYMILEVKYDKYLPAYVEQALSSIRMQRMSISKYCMARETVG